MKKILTSFLSSLVLLTLIPLTTRAQEMSAEEAMKAINKVKLDGSYVWAEGTSQKSKKEALENAHTVLNFEIINWLKETGKANADGVVMPTNDQTMKIETMKRKLYRAFVYVEKSKILPYSKDEKLIVMKTEDAQAKAKDETKGKEERKAKGEKKKKEKGEDAKVPTSTIVPIYEPTPFEQELLGVTTFNDIQPFLTRKGIKNHGKYKSRPQSGQYYVLIYNREGQVPACMRCDQGRLTNVATGMEDSLDNYKGCAGYWLMP